MTIDSKLIDKIGKSKSVIALRVSTSFKDDDSYKMFYQLLLNSIRKVPFTGLKVLIIKEEYIKKLDFSSKIALLELMKSKEFITNQQIELSNDLTIIGVSAISFESNESARMTYENLSLHNKSCVFIMQKDRITTISRGNVIEGGIFYEEKALASYQERKKVSDLKEVIKDYRNELRKLAIYSKFFISKSQLRSMFLYQNKNAYDDTTEQDFIKRNKRRINDFIKENKHLLNNKPEELFRDDLKMYLQNKLRGNIYIGKETEFHSYRRPDIYLLNEGGTEYYFIEVKWVGTSVEMYGRKAGTSYNSNDIKSKAIKQAVGYIKEVFEMEKHNMKVGYLVVFDAREGENEDTCKGFDSSTLDNSLQKYFHHFEKIDDLIVKNNPH